MAVGAILQARLGSTRLPRKVLAPVGDYLMLELQILRLLRSSNLEKLVVAIPDGQENSPIADLAKSMGVSVFAGPEEDVLQRYLLAAKAHGLDTIVRVTGDCPLVDPLTIDAALDQFNLGEHDFVSNSEPLPTLWPDGSDVSAFSFDSLCRASLVAGSRLDREHVTFPFWKRNADFRVRPMDSEDDFSHFRYTVDYPQDLEAVRAIVEKLSQLASVSPVTATMQDIVQVLRENPEIYALNSMYSRGAGWQDD